MSFWRLSVCTVALIVAVGGVSTGDRSSAALVSRVSDEPAVRPCVLISDGKVQFDMVFTGASFLDDDRLRGLVTFRVQPPPR